MFEKVKLLVNLNEYPDDFGLKENRVFFVIDKFKDVVWVRGDTDKLVCLYKSEYMFLN